MPVQNYVVARGQVGQYGEGSVLPRFVFEAAAGNAPADKRAAAVAEMVERGIIAPTDAPVNRDIAPPVPRGRAAAAGVSEDAAAELDRLRAAVADLTADRDAHQARAAHAETRRDALAAEIAAYVEANSHLRGACEEHQSARDGLEKRVAALTADLEAATAPAA